MRIVRDRRDARWLPSRFHFALFRLYAYVRMRAAKPEPVRGLILSMDRHQSHAENFLVAFCIVFVAGTYFAAWFETGMSAPLAYAAGICASVIAIQALVSVGGAIVAAVQRIVRMSDAAVTRSISITLMALMIAGGAIVSTTGASARYIARGFLILVAMNAVAAAAMFFLRGQIAEQERRVGVES